MSLASQLALAKALGLVTDAEPEPEQEGPPDFDGGAREPAPEPSDPIAGHNDLVLATFRDVLGNGTGGAAW